MADPVTAVAIGSLVLSAAGTATSVAASRKQAKQSKRQARIAQEQANVRRSRERSRQRREVLRRQAALRAAAEARGVTGSSLESGSSSALTSQEGANAGFLEAEGGRQAQMYSSQFKQADAQSLGAFGRGLTTIGQVGLGAASSWSGFTSET